MVQFSQTVHNLFPSVYEVPTMKRLFAGLMAASVLLSSVSFATPIGGNSVTVTAVTPGTAATRLGKAEDGAHTSGDVGVMGLGVRVDTMATQAGTTGDYAPLQLDANGRLRVYEQTAAADGDSAFSVLSATATGTTTLTAAATLTSLQMTDQHATTDFWVKIYDKATAATQADTPVARYFVNAQTARDFVLGTKGLKLTAGLSVRCVTEAADSGTTAAGSNECTVNGTYK